MRIDWQKEIPNLILVALPFIYLALIWNTLPDKVPLHWNINGEIDRWGTKSEILFLPFMLPLLTYVIFLVVPFIDPKKQIEKMGAKYDQLKFILVLFMSALCLFIIYAIKHQSLIHTNIIFAFTGLLFAALGNFFQTIKPNYFIGIRTPWTLEDQDIWHRTHRLSGIVWMVGGLLIVGLSLILGQNPQTLLYLYLGIVGALVIIPILYSYLLFKQHQ